MQRVISVCAVIFLLVAAPVAWAETVVTGGKTISYTVPEQFILLDARQHHEVYTLFSDLMGKGVQVQAVLLFKQKGQEGQKGQEEQQAITDDSFSEYVILASLPGLGEKKISTTEFTLLADAIRADVTTNSQASKVQEQLDACMDKWQVNGTLTLDDISPVDIIDHTERLFSFSSISTVSNSLPDDEPTLMGSLSSQMLIGGRVLSMFHYQSLASPNELTSFKERAIATRESFGFAMDAEANTKNVSERIEETTDSLGMPGAMLLLTGILLLLFGALWAADKKFGSRKK